jgi:hypothetical protein
MDRPDFRSRVFAGTGTGTATDEWRLCAVVLDSRVLRVVARGGVPRSVLQVVWCVPSRLATYDALPGLPQPSVDSVCVHLLDDAPRGLAAGHTDLAIYVAKAARKDQFQWVE